MSINKQDNWQVMDQCNCLQYKDEEGQKNAVALWNISPEVMYTCIQTFSSNYL